MPYEADRPALLIVLVRAVVGDDPLQAAAAARVLREAELVAVSLVCLCELVWVLRGVYKFASAHIAATIELLVAASNVRTDHKGVAAGLALLRAGGDFADGVIAFAGRWHGGETFVSFDRRAVSLLTFAGEDAKPVG